MSQTVVSTFYSTKKRSKDPVKSIKSTDKEKVSESVEDLQKSVPKPTRTKTKGKKINKITNYLKSEQEPSKASTEQKADLEKDKTVRTTKRNLTPEEITPSKKKPILPSEASNSHEVSPVKIKSSSLKTPRKQPAACKKLYVNSPNRYGSPKKFSSPRKTELTPQKIAAYENLSSKDLASLVNESRSKILFSGRLEDLKKSLESFSTLAAKTKEFQSNSYKISSVISSSKSNDKEQTPATQGQPARKKLFEKFSYLAAPSSESALVLPYKYKLLGETFRCLDTVVKTINNRKEKITFEKVKHGVQEMMKKNFLMDHLGQILTVLPGAYFLQYEKCDSYTIKGPTSYQLIITPNLSETDENLPETSSKENKRKTQGAFVYMTPQQLLQREHIFKQNLLEITKGHHQEFLKRKKFPVVPDEKIVRWHPEFPVDSVPNIPAAALPEAPDVKISTAKDVLNKIKGSFRGKVERALQSVSDEHKANSKEKTTPESETVKNIQNKKQNSALKGICTDLLEKIRARESAKIIETMTRSTQDEKRLAMLERIPKIVNILWHYFIAERKAAVPVDVAVDKIIHSFSSLTTPDVVKEHLELIRETMPGWLSVIKTSKGEYITIDKKKDINVMLSKVK